MCPAHFVLTLSLLLTAMPDKDDLSLGEPSQEEKEFEELRRRFDALPTVGDRKRTFKRLSQMYFPHEDLPFTEEETGKTSVSQSLDMSASGGHKPQTVTQTVQSTNVTVEDGSLKKLPRFSGAEKPSQGEVTYRKWRREAQRLIDDKSVKEEQKRRAVFRSLSGGADDIADINKSLSVSELIVLFDATYGCLIDGEELLIEFYDILQTKQTASEYLSELYVELGEVIQYGGLPIESMNKALLKQFLRGCTDDDLLVKLRLDDKLLNPPSFAELIQVVRTEEVKRKARRLRLKKQAKVQSALVQQPKVDPEVERLQQRLEQLEATAAASVTVSPVAPTPAPVSAPE